MTKKRNDYYYDDAPDDYTSDPEELRRQMLREKRRRKEARRRRKYRKWLMQRIAIITGLIVVLALLIFGIVKLVGAVRGMLKASQTPMLIEQDSNGGNGDGTQGDAGTEGATEGATEDAEETQTDAYAVFTEDENTVVMSSLHRADGSEDTASTEDGQASEEDDTTPEPTSSEADTSADPAGETETYSFDQDFIDASVAVGFSGEGTDYVASEYAILVNVDTGKILLDRDARTRMSPASMTKVLTVLVAAENLASDDALKDTVTITQDIVDECYLSDSSSMYYVNGDQISVEELFYGAILPSGADAAIALAQYTAGSEEAFVQMMNDKLAELGLSETTHMTNPVGTYNEDHYSTAYDMAVIMKAAMDNEFCREVLSAHTYQAAPSISYPNGDHVVSNWFLRRIEDKDTHGTVIGAKTGFVNESGCCAVSYQTSNDGTNYICCTADTWGAWRAIYDHVAIYSHFTN